MISGVQFTGSVPSGTTRRWFVHSVPESWNLLWMVVPTWPMNDGGAQVEWNVQTTRQASNKVKYFIEVTNVSGSTIEFEARYAALNS